MDNTWIKLYRKTKENGILKDHNAWALFSWLLLTVDTKTGKTTFGRFQISDELAIKPNTVYKVVKRLEKKYGVITVIRQTNYTEVQIVNWAKYQSPSTDRKITVKSSSNESNTLQEERIKNTSYIQLTARQKEKLQKEFPTVKVDFELQKFSAWQKANGKQFANVLERFRLWLLDVKDSPKTYKSAVARGNPILEDPLFKRLQDVYTPSDDIAMRTKMVLESQLGTKYPAFKHELDWQEAKQKLRGLQN